MWNESRTGWMPNKGITKEEWESLKLQPVSKPEKGFFGHLCSFRSQYFQGYATHITETNVLKSAKRLNMIGKKLTGDVKQGDYTQFSHLKNTIIYCDPPYEGTICRYKEESTGNHLSFDHERFRNWCEQMKLRGNIIYVSGYTSTGDLVWNRGKEMLSRI